VTAVLGFVEVLDPYRIGLKELLNDVAVGMIDLTAEVSSSGGNQISHAINEKSRVGDAVFFFQFV
jgi:hypothetical protein